MSVKLLATLEQRRGGNSVIKLAGVLDEHNDLADIGERVGAGKTLINLAGVERINSIGTRDWVNWLASLERRGIRPVLVACSPAVVAQLNVVNNFAGNACVKSFQVPYHCSACDLHKLLLVNVADMSTRHPKAPPCTCDGCGLAMTFVDESGTYFAFLANLKPEVARESSPDLARGSNAEVTMPPQSRPSEPRAMRESSSYLSAFQVSGGRSASQPRIPFERPSQQLIPTPASPAADRTYLLVIVLLLVCTIGVLAFIVLTR